MKITPRYLEIVIGPDTEGSGVTWVVYESDEPILSDGSAGMPLAHNRTDPDAWLRYAKRKVRVRGRIQWEKATHKPFGWSQGAGHAPQGIKIRVPVHGE